MLDFKHPKFAGANLPLSKIKILEKGIFLAVYMVSTHPSY